jgi:hypothetical protein
MPSNYYDVVPAVTISVRRFRITTKVTEPVQVNNQEFVDRQRLDEVAERCMTLAARASYQVNGANREVFWAVHMWEAKRHEWHLIVEGKSRVRDRPVPNRRPVDGGRFPKELG